MLCDPVVQHLLKDDVIFPLDRPLILSTIIIIIIYSPDHSAFSRIVYRVRRHGLNYLWYEFSYYCDYCITIFFSYSSFYLIISLGMVCINLKTIPNFAYTFLILSKYLKLYNFTINNVRNCIRWHTYEVCFSTQKFNLIFFVFRSYLG